MSKTIYQYKSFIGFTWDIIGEEYDPAFIEIENEKDVIHNIYSPF